MTSPVGFLMVLKLSINMFISAVNLNILKWLSEGIDSLLNQAGSAVLGNVFFSCSLLKK